MMTARALVRRLAQLAADGRDGAGEAERGFAWDWYLLVASFRHGRAEVGWSRAYLAEARALFPSDPAVVMISYAGLALRGANNARTLLLLFSDGLGTSSILSASRLMAVARRSDAIVYAIGVREMPRLVRGPVFTQNEALTDDRFLNALARETGGRVFTPSSIEISSERSRACRKFNSRYVLGYTPRGVAQPGWHKLEARLKTRRGDVLVRRGYFGTY